MSTEINTWFPKLIIYFLVGLVLLLGILAILLFLSSLGDYAEMKEVWELFMVPMLTVIAAIVALIFGNTAARVIDNRNRLASDRDEIDTTKLGLHEIKLFD